MKKRIRYKVIKDRKSCKVPAGSKYSLEYKKGIVKAVPGSFGIMVFKTLYDAQCFHMPDTEIIKVRPIGRRRKITVFASCVGNATKNTANFNKFYKIYNLKKRYKKWFVFFDIDDFLYPPKGTECYKSIEVLE